MAEPRKHEKYDALIGILDHPIHNFRWIEGGSSARVVARFLCLARASQWPRRETAAAGGAPLSSMPGGRNGESSMRTL
jgi:hypothetical protein